MSSSLRAIEVTVCESSLCDEEALVDPESEQWHLVPGGNLLKKARGNSNVMRKPTNPAKP